MCKLPLSARRVSVILVVAVGLAGCQTASPVSAPLMLTTDLNTICSVISPGNELAVRFSVNGPIYKFTWSVKDCVFTSDGQLETLKLVAVNQVTGTGFGNDSDKLVLTIARSGGLKSGSDFLDLPLAGGQVTKGYDLAITASPAINALSTQSGTGSATLSEYNRSGARITLRFNFHGPMLNLANGQMESVCGEAYFDAPVAGATD